MKTEDRKQSNDAKLTRERRSSPTAASPATASVQKASPLPPAHIDATNLIYGRGYRRWWRPWRCGGLRSMAMCQRRPWKRKIGLHHASTRDYKASAPTISTNGGRRRCGHGDEARPQTPTRSVRGAAALPSTAREQGGCGGAVGVR